MADPRGAGRELDEAVHRRVFGLDPERTFVNSYSDDSAPGWASIQAVVERLIAAGWRPLMEYNGDWIVTLEDSEYPVDVLGAVAKGLPEAICRAALKVFK